MNQLIFKLLRSQLQEISPADLLTAEETELLQDPEVQEALFARCAPQDLTHLIGAALFLLRIPRDTEAAKKFRYSQISAVQRYEKIRLESESLYRFFEETGVKYIPLKGTVLRRFYPMPEQRTSCDIDLLVQPEDLEKTASALEEKRNYRRTHEGGHDVGFVSPAGVNLELHFTLIEKNDYPEIAEILEGVWEHTVPEAAYPHQYRMTMVYEYFYHIAHMVKHYLYGGCGIRTFMDLWVYNHRCPGFDREENAELLRKGGIAAFEEKAEMLSEMWFSGTQPDPADTDLMEQMENYIFGGGIYGNTENRVKIGRTEKKNLQYVRSRLILPYERMQYEFPVLREHPVLLPVCHVRRWMRLLSASTTRRVVSELKMSSAVTEEENAEIRRMLDELGLK